MPTFAFVGTNTNPLLGRSNGEGIYVFELDHATGKLNAGKLAAPRVNASWLCLHPSKPVLYAVHQTAPGNGSVSAFTIDSSTGDLQLLNTQSSMGEGPAHLSVDATGSFVFVANYAGGSIAVLPILATGALAPAVFTRQNKDFVGAQRATNAPPGSFAISGHDAPHAHMIVPDPANRFVLHTDLGQDRIYIDHLDPHTGHLTPASTPFVQLPSGDGPRHLAFHPNGRALYSLQEEASTVVLFQVDPATATLNAHQTISALPATFTGTSFASAIVIAPNGKFLYTANRLHNTIAVFALRATGHLQHIGETATLGDYPNAFNLHGDYLHVCNHRSDQITTFAIDPSTGLLAFTGQYTAVGSPSCIVFT